MKPDELRNLTKEELQEKEQELEEELFNLRFQVATQRISNPVRLREARRDLARVKTILHEDALGRYKLATRGPKEE